MSRAASDKHSLDWGAACETGFAFPSIHLETAQILPGPTIRKQVGEIIEGGSPTLDRSGEHLLHRTEEGLNLFCDEVPTRSEWVDSR